MNNENVSFKFAAWEFFFYQIGFLCVTKRFLVPINLFIYLVIYLSCIHGKKSADPITDRNSFFGAAKDLFDLANSIKVA